jgi:hypothetical protein
MATMFCVSQAIAGPLGLEMGQSLASISKLLSLKKDKDSQFLYSATTTPRPHTDFDQYLFLITPKHGLCKIIASSKIIRTNMFGEALQSKFEEIQSAVSGKYGKPETSDSLREGSLWSDDRYWMMGLVEKERVLAAVWSSNDTIKLPDSIDTIIVKTHALGMTSGYVSLVYYFNNSDDCADTVKKQKGSNL